MAVTLGTDWRGAGLGAMQALELVCSKTTRQPADEETKQVSQYCYEHGVVTITAGSYSNVIRLLMPLVITMSRCKSHGRARGCIGACRRQNGALKAQLT